jgi:hypothetical protein
MRLGPSAGEDSRSWEFGFIVLYRHRCLPFVTKKYAFASSIIRQFAHATCTVLYTP